MKEQSMIDIGYVQTMARYGAWQNESLAIAADGLPDTARLLDRGAFFGSIFGTLNHLLWGDTLWMSRFAGGDAPRMASIAESNRETETWASYRDRRKQMDQAISVWADELTADWLTDEMSWFSGAAQRDVTKPNNMLVLHFFNHATHHRGQAHAMLTAVGARPDDTDLFLMP